MNKKFIAFLALIFIILLILLARDFFVKTIFGRTIEGLSGLKISADSVDVSVFNTSVRCRGMVILNPPSFPDKVMARINRLYVDYDFTSGFRGEIHIKDMVFDVGLVNVIKNKEGENNLNSLKIVDALKNINKEQKANNVMPRIRIDRLRLKGGKVVYKDYTKAPYPAVTEFEVRVDEEYRNITNPYELVSLIVSSSLVKTSPSSIIGFDLTPFQSQVKDAMSKGMEAIKNTTEQFKKALQINN